MESTFAASPAVSIDDALATLSAHEYRLTEPRRIVLASVLRKSNPFTAEQIVAESSGIGRSTVYRTLEILASVDLLNRLLGVDGHPVYIVGQPGHRHHLICSDCGGVVEFTTCPMDDLIDELQRETSYQIDGHHIEITGRCPNCQPPAIRQPVAV